MRTQGMGAGVNRVFTMISPALTITPGNAPHGGRTRGASPAPACGETLAIRARAACEQSGKIAPSAIRSCFVPETVLRLTDCVKTAQAFRRG